MERASGKNTALGVVGGSPHAYGRFFPTYSDQIRDRRKATVDRPVSSRARILVYAIRLP